MKRLSIVLGLVFTALAPGGVFAVTSTTSLISPGSDKKKDVNDEISRISKISSSATPSMNNHAVSNLETDMGDGESWGSSAAVSNHVPDTQVQLAKATRPARVDQSATVTGQAPVTAPLRSPLDALQISGGGLKSSDPSVSATDQRESNGFYDQLDSVRKDTILAKAQLADLEIRHKVQEARQGNFESNKSSTSILPPPGLSRTFEGPPKSNDLLGLDIPKKQNPVPTVSQVGMADGQWFAQVKFESGGIRTVRIGDRINGVGIVSVISLTDVVIHSKRSDTHLQFAEFEN